MVRFNFKFLLLGNYWKSWIFEMIYCQNFKLYKYRKRTRMTTSVSSEAFEKKTEIQRNER